MSIIKRLSKAAAKFIVTETSASALGRIGEHLGDAIGNILAKKIDPTYGQPPGAKPAENKEETEAKEPVAGDTH